MAGALPKTRCSCGVPGCPDLASCWAIAAERYSCNCRNRRAVTGLSKEIQVLQKSVRKDQLLLPAHSSCCQEELSPVRPQRQRLCCAPWLHVKPAGCQYQLLEALQVVLLSAGGQQGGVYVGGAEIDVCHTAQHGGGTQSVADVVAHTSTNATHTRDLLYAGLQQLAEPCLVTILPRHPASAPVSSRTSAASVHQ